MWHIFLDSSPLGLLANPAQTGEVIAIAEWATQCLSAGNKIYVPEVIDYEVRRELVRAGKSASVAKLDLLKTVFRYRPLTTESMILAADLWARSRNQGLTTTDPKRIDVDVILSAQAIVAGTSLGLPLSEMVIATTNSRHLSQFVSSELWQNITP